MGIPKFFSWFSRNDPFSTTVSTDRPEDVYFFGIDLNAVIHPAAAEETDVAAINMGGSYVMSEELFYQRRANIFPRVWQKIVGLTNTIRPRKILMIAVDGVAPQAKMNQQRNRRFKSAAARKPEAIFDSNAITPGTPFMIELDKYLQEQFRKVKEQGLLSNVFPPTVLYSSHLVPGEGEHKIADYLRSLNANNQKAVIYGADADLTMIYSMVLKASQQGGAPGWDDILLFRNSVTRSEKKPIDIVRELQVTQTGVDAASLLREMESLLIAGGGESAQAIIKLKDLERFFSVNPEASKKVYQLSQALSGISRLGIEAIVSLKQLQVILEKLFDGAAAPVDDFVTIIFLIGNDFLPHFPTFERVHDALNTLIGGYYEYIQQNKGKNIGITTGSNINWPNFAAYLRYITEKYNDILLKLWGENRDAVIKFPSIIAENCVQRITVIGAETTCERKLDVAKFNNLWYVYLFSSKLGSPVVQPTQDDIDRILGHYLEGVSWVYNYYRHGVAQVNVGWYYPYHYSPLFSDLHDYISRNPTAPWEIESIQERSQFVSPLVQLAMVIPPKSLSVTYQVLYPLYTEQSPIYDLYPDTFLVDNQGKMDDWQSIAILPIPQVERVILTVNLLGLGETFVSQFLPQDPIFYERNLIAGLAVSRGGSSRGRGGSRGRGPPRGRGGFRGRGRGEPARGSFRGTPPRGRGRGTGSPLL